MLTKTHLPVTRNGHDALYDAYLNLDLLCGFLVRVHDNGRCEIAVENPPIYLEVMTRMIKNFVDSLSLP